MPELPPKKLIEVAQERNCNSIAKLSQITRVDRKTLKKINEGGSANESTLKRIADGLRVPVSYFLGEQVGSEPASQSTDSLELRPLGGKLLRQLLDKASQPEHVHWHAALDKVDDALHSALLNIEKRVAAYVDLNRGRGEWSEKHGSLEAQLLKVRAGDELDELIQGLRSQGVKLFGASWVKWRCETKHYWIAEDGYTELDYVSEDHALISVDSKTTAARQKVDCGDSPPHRFNPPGNIVGINVNGVTVWERGQTEKPALDLDDTPF